MKAANGVNQSELCRRITEITGLGAFTRLEFVWMTVNYFMKYTGIPINFGISVALGFFVGTVIAGQTFYNFTLDNLKYFGTLKAMGADGRHAPSHDSCASNPGRKHRLWTGSRLGQRLWSGDGEDRIGILDAVATAGDQWIRRHTYLCNIRIYKHLQGNAT